MSNSKTVFRGQVSILNSGQPFRYGNADLLLPEGVINITGRNGANNNIASIAADVNLTTTTSGNVVVNSAGNFNSTSSNTTITSTGTAPGAGNVAVTSSNQTIIRSNANLGSGGLGNIVMESIGGTAGNITITTDNTTGGNISITSTGTTATGGVISINTERTAGPGAGIAIATAGSAITIGNTASSGEVTLGFASKNTNVAGNLVVTGDLTVNGTITSINTETTTIEDNILLLNSNVVSGTVDAGILVKRYQINNDTGAGAIITGGNATTSGNIVSSTGTTAVLANTASGVDDIYNNGWIHIFSGTGSSGGGQVRKIIDYVGSTRTITVAAWTVNPDATSQYRVYVDKEYSGLVYQESANTWVIGSTATDPAAVAIDDLTPEDLKLRNLNVTGAITGAITAFTTADVTILESNTTAVNIPNISKNRGSGHVFITGRTANSASAVFLVSKSDTTEVGQVQRITSSSSSTNAELDVQWPASGVLQVFHSTAGTGGSVVYDIVVIVV